MGRKIIKATFLVLAIGLLGYCGACVYGNFIAKPAATIKVPKMPDVKEATHSVLIKSSGTLILVSDYEQFGDTVNERIFILHGYWEQTGNEFIYRESDIILSEQVFGEIIVKRRTV